MFSQIKALVQQMLGPAYDYVMPVIGILIPFRYPGNFYWLFVLSTIGIALVLYATSATDEEPRTLKGFWRFLAPREVYVTRSAWLDGKYYVVSSLLNMQLHLAALAFALGSTLSTAQAAKLGLTWVLGPGPQGVDPPSSPGSRIPSCGSRRPTRQMGQPFHAAQGRVPLGIPQAAPLGAVLTPLTNLRVHPMT